MSRNEDIKGIEIDFIIGDEEVSLDTKKELVISDDLHKEVDRAASNIAYYGALKSLAKKRLNKAELHYKVWRAKTKAAISNTRERNDQKALTKEMMEAEIHQHPSYIKWKTLINLREQQYEVLTSAYDAFRAKKDMVQTKAADMREERRGELRIKEERIKDHFRSKHD